MVYTEEKTMLIFTNDEIQWEKTLPIRSLNLIYQHKTFYL